MNCPSCSAPLKEIHFEGVKLHSCDGCGGEFVTPEALAHIVNTRDEKFTPAMRKTVAGRKPVAGIPADMPLRKMTCPACGSKTTTMNYAVDTGVCVDRCDVCGGIWLDKDELEHIQIILEQAEDAFPTKMTAAQRELQKAKEQASSQTSGAFEASRLSFVNAIVNRFLDAA